VEGVGTELKQFRKSAQEKGCRGRGNEMAREGRVSLIESLAGWPMAVLHRCDRPGPPPGRSAQAYSGERHDTVGHNGGVG
jgi:hypothetical protein